MSRVLALDPGSRRIGVAVSDGDRTTAVPVGVVEVTADRPRLHRRLAELVAEHEAALVVVGLPLSLDGSEGAAAGRARRLGDELAAAVSVPVVHHDERFTTVTADRLLAEAGHDARARRKVVDQVAASVLLQSWLDGQRAQPTAGADVEAGAGR